MSVDLQRLLRLEIERDPDPGELINLVPNPDGGQGAWGWVTPVVGSNLRSNPAYGLVYTSPGSVPSYFYSVPLDVTAGQYVAASWLASSVLGRYTAKIEWLDAARTVLSATTATSNLTGSPDVAIYGQFLAPASTVYCRIRFDHHDASGGDPTALSWMSITGVTLTAADVAGELSVTRTNLVTNPSAEIGSAAGWSCDGGTIDTSTAHATSGSRSFRVTKTGDRGALVARTTIADIVPGRDYASQVRAMTGGATGRFVSIGFSWKNAAGKEIGRPVVGPWTIGDDWISPFGIPLTAPTAAASAELLIVFADVSEGGVRYFDGVMVEQASALGAYFDGDTTSGGGITYSWTGTSQASASTAVTATGNVGTLVPVPYQNILGPTSQIAIDREELNVGSMSVKLFDAVLDPTQGDLIKTGRRIRLVATPADAAPEVLFTGKVFTGAVTYRLLHPDENKRAEVTLTAVDPINPLANTPSREGVATIAELPHVLEAAGVPWSVNGDGNQVASPTVVAYNDNASALDQVAVTRDSVLGYSWVDRTGVLQAWDRDELDATVAAELDESTYNADLDVDFDLERLINSVTVRVLRIIATTGATEEVTFGPYVDTDSYRLHGEHAQEFVVQGIDVSDTAAIQEYAEAILAANAEARMRVNALVLPIAGPKLDEPAIDRALLDLYDLVTVVNGRASINEASRITRIHHEITATSSGGKWLTTLGFGAEGSVAPSTAVPSPPPGVGEVVDDVRGGYDGSLQEIFDAADLAAAAAAAAAESATVALTAANGKNKTIYSTSVPGTTANVAGDIWFRKDAATQTIIGQWQGLGGTSWQQVSLNDQVIANLDAGKLVAGSAFTNALWVKTNLTLGDASTNGVIQSHDFAGSSVGVYIDKFGMVAKGGSMTGTTLNAVTTTSGTFQTASSGKRIAISSGVITAYPSSGTAATIDMSSSGTIAIAATSLSLSGSLSAAGVSAGGYFTSGTATLGTVATNYISGGGFGINFSNGLVVTGGILTTQDIFGGGAVHAATSFFDDSLDGGGGTGANINDNGKIIRTPPSSRRFKTDITPIGIGPEALLSVEGVSFRYKDADAHGDELQVGLIAEDLEAAGLGAFVTRNRAGEITGILYDRLVVAVLPVLRDLTARIEALEIS